MLKRSDDGSSGGVRHRTVNFEYKKIGVSGGRPGRPGHNIEIATATNGGAHTPALKTLTPNKRQIQKELTKRERSCGTPQRGRQPLKQGGRTLRPWARPRSATRRVIHVDASGAHLVRRGARWLGVG